MGIKGINTLLKRYSPEAFFTIPITLLSGKRVAIDGNNWMYTNMAIARKKVINKTDITNQEPSTQDIRREWFLAALNFVLGWLSHNITPVFVFDGRHPPEKDETKAKRRDARIAARAKIDALYQQLRGDILTTPANIIEELKKELRNYNFISTEDFELFKMVMKGIGIPCLQAIGDGEHLCSSLCIEGKVAAVFSADTDNLVYGCPLVMTGFSETCSYDEQGNKVSRLDCVRLDKILDGLKFTHDLFVDLCIMSGCDFNTNMPGYAAIKSYNLLQKCGSIDDLPRNLNTECLKHVRCRQIFAFAPSDTLIAPLDVSDPDPDLDDIIQTGYEFIHEQGINKISTDNSGPLDIDKRAIMTARDYLEIAGISGQIDRIIATYHHVTPAINGSVELLELGPAPRYVPPPRRMLLNIISRPPGDNTRFISIPSICGSTPSNIDYPITLQGPASGFIPMPVLPQPTVLQEQQNNGITKPQTLMLQGATNALPIHSCPLHLPKDEHITKSSLGQISTNGLQTIKFLSLNVMHKPPPTQVFETVSPE
jgi:flap endonuclease-1